VVLAQWEGRGTPRILIMFGKTCDVCDAVSLSRRGPRSGYGSKLVLYTAVLPI